MSSEGLRTLLSLMSILLITVVQPATHVQWTNRMKRMTVYHKLRVTHPELEITCMWQCSQEVLHPSFCSRMEMRFNSCYDLNEEYEGIAIYISL